MPTMRRKNVIAKLRGQVQNIQTQLDVAIKTPNELKA